MLENKDSFLTDRQPTPNGLILRVLGSLGTFVKLEKLSCSVLDQLGCLLAPYGRQNPPRAQNLGLAPALGHYFTKIGLHAFFTVITVWLREAHVTCCKGTQMPHKVYKPL